MGAKDVIRNGLDTSDFVLKSYLNDLSDDDLRLVPVQGMHPIALQLGHLISAERMFQEMVEPGSAPPLPDGFAEAHDLKKADGDPSRFKSREEYLKLWDEQRAGQGPARPNRRRRHGRYSRREAAPLGADRLGRPEHGGNARADARRSVRRRPASAQQADRVLTTPTGGMPTSSWAWVYATPSNLPCPRRRGHATPVIPCAVGSVTTRAVGPGSPPSAAGRGARGSPLRGTGPCR